MKRLFILLAIASLAGLGCDKKSETPAEGEKAKTEEKAPALTDDDLPVEGDFVEEAESTISKDNYKSELDKLATEIEKE